MLSLLSTAVCPAMFPSGPPGHLYDNSDATDGKPQQQSCQQPDLPPQHPPSRGPYLTQQQHLPPSNSNPPVPFYQPPPTLVHQHHPPEQRLQQHYPHYGYSLRIPITMDEQLHPALGYLPDQTQGRGTFNPSSPPFATKKRFLFVIYTNPRLCQPVTPHMNTP